MKDALRNIARQIWEAGVAAVRSERLVKNVVHRTPTLLQVCGESFPLSTLGRIVVVGAGKAGAGMAAAVEDVLGEDFDDRLTGWVNVPADCVRPLRRIHLHAARPAGVNEPTLEGVAGTAKILELVTELGPDDLCLVLLSGGGSALLPAPVEGITLADKQAVTRFLMHAGATIHDLNTVRKPLSKIKGGRLAQAIGAGRGLALVISDVIGDPLEIIASGPTVPTTTTAADALEILKRFGARPPEVPESVFDVLRLQVEDLEKTFEPAGIATEIAAGAPAGVATGPATASGKFINRIIGNNQTALDAAADCARQLGYVVHSLGSDNGGDAETVGRDLAERCLSIRDRHTPSSPPVCLLSGGEPVVHFSPTDQPRKGGRNQQLILAAADRLWNDGLRQMVLLSGGTDGEDGPTDAAGAFVDAGLVATGRRLHLNPGEYLSRQNAYPFFEQVGGLLQTGPTHTNVMDLRVCVIGETAAGRQTE